MTTESGPERHGSCYCPPEASPAADPGPLSAIGRACRRERAYVTVRTLSERPDAPSTRALPARYVAAENGTSLTPASRRHRHIYYPRGAGETAHLLPVREAAATALPHHPRSALLGATGPRGGQIGPRNRLCTAHHRPPDAGSATSMSSWTTTGAAPPLEPLPTVAQVRDEIGRAIRDQAAGPSVCPRPRVGWLAVRVEGVGRTLVTMDPFRPIAWHRVRPPLRAAIGRTAPAWLAGAEARHLG